MPEKTDPAIDELALRSRVRAVSLIDDAQHRRTRHERVVQRRFTRLFRDPEAVQVTIELTDDVMRFTSSRPAARALRAGARRASVRGFGLANALGLRALSALSRVAPGVAVGLVHWRVRGLTRDLIGDAAPSRLGELIARRRDAGLAVNVNVLGEAVLGEREAAQRLERVLEVMERSDVDYVSVKLSSLVSQIVTFDHDGSRARVAVRLRELYRRAARTGVFVNLDMEEYRDLRMTLEAFTQVLGEEEFRQLSAGIVLQAYLPESHGAFEELVAWARARVGAGGAAVKVRLVKGANLAMEATEAELHGWRAAPYGSKVDVDASYLRLLDVALRPEVAPFVRVGVASHNLFHVVYALDVARSRGVEDQLDVEMLEGMAPAEASALVATGQRVLLYAPVTRREDFAAAVAYLVRRLDENTSPENYLRAAFLFERDRAIVAEQGERFLAAVTARHAVDTARRRDARSPEGEFFNEPDGDPTSPEYVARVREAAARLVESAELVIGAPSQAHEFERGGDPSDSGRAWYRYYVASVEQVDAALATATAAHAPWEARGARARAEILARVAEVMARRRPESIALMGRDTGKTVAEADPEVSEAIDFVRYYAAMAQQLGESSPQGVVLVVPPWNFPYSIPTGGVAAALAAGNAVILKPAPEAVAVGAAVAEHFWAGGVPREVLQLVCTRDDDVGRHLVSHDALDALVLTGSYETARLFSAWRPELTLLGETSGKNAILVTACADVDVAVRDLVHSAFSNAGQKCSAASLAIVERSIWEESRFVEQLVDAVTSLAVGAATAPECVVGPVIRPPEAALQRALTSCEGDEYWLVEPRPLDAARLLWSPGVKVGVAPGSWSHLNEWFGPVLGVMIAPDFETGLRWQNMTPYGLTAGICSLDEDECELWIERVEAGNLYVNRGITGAVVRRQPFGGWKKSAVGPTAKAGGPHYVEVLRRWPEVRDAARAMREAREWWSQAGSLARDDSALSVERNLFRYRSAGSTLVRVDETFSDVAREYLLGLSELLGLTLDVSVSPRAQSVVGVSARVESVEELVSRLTGTERVRWLSREAAPVSEILERGASLDRRALSQDGAVEAPRWLREQSVAITNHRYGDVHAGPRPSCRGLGE